MLYFFPVDYPANGTSQLKMVPGKNIRFTIRFTVQATDSDHTYQWQRNGNNLTVSDGDKYRGTDTATLTVVNVVKEDEGNFMCTVTNTEGSVPSSVAELIICKCIYVFVYICCIVLHVFMGVCE